MFVIWHSISVPTARPHSHWKVRWGLRVEDRQSPSRPPPESVLTNALLVCTCSPPGKVFRCSALSCSESFPSMQELVAHGKLHYKPNRYFK